MRPTRHETMLEVASVFAKRSTCPRRQVGCVITDKEGRVLSTGYNGVARGMIHCTEVRCPGAGLPSGQGLDKCEAIHGESNALLQCKQIDDIAIIYVTASPCMHCTKLLLQTPCYEIIFMEEYPHSDAKALWEKAGRIWAKWPKN